MKYIDIQTDEDLVKFADYITGGESLNVEAIALIKEADLDDDYSVLIDEAFADAGERTFPIHTPEDTAMSAVYINNQKEDVPLMVKTACQAALDEWGITSISISTEELGKTASEAVDMQEIMLLPSLEKLPAIDAPTLLKSATTLSGHFHTLTTAQKVEGSLQLKKFAQIYGVSMDDFDPKFNVYSLDANCDLGKLANDISARIATAKELSQKEEYQNLLGKMAEYKKECGGDVSEDKGINTSIAYDLLELDKTAGLMNHFDAISDTFNTVSYETEGGLSKIADSQEIGQEDLVIGGYNIPLVKVASLFEDDAVSIFSDVPGQIVENGGVNIDNLEESISKLPFSFQNEIAKRILQA